MTEEIYKICEDIRTILLNSEFNREIRSSIIDNYCMLGVNTSVAVRSSATAEDLEDASFAGQQDTYLNISGEDNVLLSVKKCMVSLWNDRAVIYRMKNNIDHRNVGISVVVQVLVNAKVAGVMFTSNPITSCRKEIVIGANEGLG